MLQQTEVDEVFLWVATPAIQAKAAATLMRLKKRHRAAMTPQLSHITVDAVTTDEALGWT